MCSPCSSNSPGFHLPKAPSCLLPRSRFSLIPSHLLSEWIDGTSALALLLTSRELKKTGALFFQKHAQTIVQQCPGSSSLYTQIHRGFATHNAPGLIALLPQYIRAMGIPRCPNRILTLKEIHKCNTTIENGNLLKIWPTLREALHPLPLDVSEVNALPREIRTWMHRNTAALQKITELNLSKHQLTCIPTEIGLCTGLELLDLSHNRLVFFPKNLFRRMDSLLELSLNHNRLTFLPEDFFRGLDALVDLDISHNPLTALTINTPKQLRLTQQPLKK
jgi:hypothetical protein